MVWLQMIFPPGTFSGHRRASKTVLSLSLSLDYLLKSGQSFQSEFAEYMHTGTDTTAGTCFHGFFWMLQSGVASVCHNPQL